MKRRREEKKNEKSKLREDDGEIECHSIHYFTFYSLNLNHIMGETQMNSNFGGINADSSIFIFLFFRFFLNDKNELYI